ncbi:hypothetical protein QBC34DRAFT_461777 [Podospora aff. communis PSN243]|uniref:DUF6594 domain-containing protein n=1 Tax=Podospora aff. communis PSN243 TaxID=3040156 RepID=A0AAV9GSH9_9PEZI|nr:hypothetical protein QBC34DRAFT_461777 [Podospora aff. communis PSN243]
MPLESDSENFIRYVNRSLDEEEDFHFLRFEFLQRLNLAQLQVKLVRMKSEFQKRGKASPEELETLQTTLEAYATAIRNYGDLRSAKDIDKTETNRRKLLLQRFFQSENDFNDPFHSHYAFFKHGEKQIDPVRRALMRYLPSRLAYSEEERGQRSREYAEGKPPLRVSRFVDRLVRFSVAITGETFLVVPMLIMAIDSSQVKSLATVSVSVVVFALILSFAIRLSNVETLVSTATYAAVLVVFVGTSVGGGP